MKQINRQTNLLIYIVIHFLNISDNINAMYILGTKVLAIAVRLLSCSVLFLLYLSKRNRRGSR